MTLNQLRNWLNEALQEPGVTEETEVRIASQPRYPLQHSIACVTVLREEEEGTTIVYLAEGSSEGYGSREAWDGRSG